MSIPASSVPPPISSRSPPSSASVHSMPMPMQTPSNAACSGGFLLAKASTRASTMQLVTIRGMKMPRTRYNSCSWALNSRSTTVTSAATIRMKTGMRISCGIRLRSDATATLAMAMTMIVASDSITPLTRLVVTASSGQRPRICTRLVFWCQTPLAPIWRNSSRLIISLLLWQRVAGDSRQRSVRPCAPP
ncbi:MAG: hypothetical protein AW06_001837 [Candidatus Accumulibacter cognatus]|uniref:Uncharacterized protein n=1 Tax=Candidatus Accumulibacter cognatus TaxID=2954383 RepID=A0A080M777_9PROT|nr:MAG: hypothetical protein AW06_001837 [Candidatus Accumulibacter cognatus]